jgi:TnpA family transposase
VSTQSREDQDLRRRCHVGLNKGEARNSLAQAIFAHKQGRITDRTLENQSYRASGLNLVITAIVYWNTLYMAERWSICGPKAGSCRMSFSRMSRHSAGDTSA